MPVFRTKEEAYKRCSSEGNFNVDEEVDYEKIKSNLKICEEDIASAKDSAKKARWNAAYKSYYDALHILVESFLCFDKIKSSNHQCLFAYLCIKHPELEFDWNFFEKIRTKRNGINYYGQPVSEKDLKEIGLQISLYISTLKKEIEKKLKNME